MLSSLEDAYSRTRSTGEVGEAHTELHRGGRAVERRISWRSVPDAKMSAKHAVRYASASQHHIAQGIRFDRVGLDRPCPDVAAHKAVCGVWDLR